MNIRLTSGELASVEIIPRSEAIAILSKPAFRRTWFGRKYKAPHRVSRGPGAAVDLINYGLQAAGKCRAVVRIGPAPWGNRPVVAAVGPDLAPYTAYLMRLWGAGISSDDLAAFLETVKWRFPRDMRRRDPDRDFRYLLSLDSLAGRLIEAPQGIYESPPVAGRIYHAAGALYAGPTGRSQPTRYVDPDTGQIKSVYRAGRNISAELRQKGVRFISDGAKHRFIFILAEPGSLKYVTYRTTLPDRVREYEWGEHSLGWIQPRLLAGLLHRYLIDLLSLKENLRCKRFQST